ncbi:unnamed protein product [Cyprideis torosa]|uniref:Uncharacterized protein n=1 Tax=Cyprideis torosa TaxID=163714 RepID=A0A7R8WE10_9CRUS|nr:unnamed protein product [Cyprideis torosa]CAG0888917.1 unnamed protein product [Cyprideis torosa]
MGESPETETQPIRKQGLLYTNSDLTNRLVSGLYQMMKNKQFCDVVFSIGKFEVPAHRNVLACASPYLNSLFSKPQQEESQERVTIEFEEHQVKKECLKLIIDYIYTARLEVPDHLVVETYIAASRLQITDARRACANYLLSNLDISNCLLLRSTPETEHEKSLSAALDAFIAEKIKNIVSDGALKVAQLPSITVELLQSTIEDAKAVQIAPLADLILDWIKRDTAGEADLDAMTERTHLLYCSNDNIIHDCSDIEDTDTESELIQDYKKMAKRHVAQNKSRHRRRATPTKPVRFLIYSRRASDMKAENEEQGVEERKWRIVAYTEVGDLAYVALAMLDGRLFKVSVSIRVQSLNTNTPSRPIPLDVSEIPLPRMSSNRGALGATVLNDCIVVMGGNDRGECMKSGEIYDPITNAWSPCISMGTPRARFGLAASDGTLYAIGGSDGRGELASVEYLAPGATQWKYHTKLPSGKSQFSVAVLNGLLYCVGGNTTQGQAASTQCEVFDPKLGTWTEIDSLHDGRCNLGLVTFRDELWAVGGSNAWAAIPTVEIYNPRSGNAVFALYDISSSGRPRWRRRIPGGGDDNSDDSDDSSSSDDEEDDFRRGRVRRVDKEEDVGHVVCVDVEKKKQGKASWFPGLVVAPTAQDAVRIRVSKEYLIRSFQDGRYYTVPKRDTHPFTPEVASKVDKASVLNAAVEKAMLYLNKDDLPPHWDRDLLFGKDLISDHDSSDSGAGSDNETREEKDHFVASLYKFMDDRDTPIDRAPSIGGREVDFYRLFMLVRRYGGYNKVTNHSQWKEVYQKMGFPANGGGPAGLKQAYRRYLYSFESFYRKLGCTLVNHPRGSRSRHQSNRSLIRNTTKTPVHSPGNSKQGTPIPSGRRTAPSTSKKEDGAGSGDGSTASGPSSVTSVKKEKDDLPISLESEAQASPSSSSTRSDPPKRTTKRGRPSESSSTGKGPNGSGSRKRGDIDDSSSGSSSDSDGGPSGDSDGAIFVNDTVRVIYGGSKSSTTYEAKIMDIKTSSNGMKRYFVHYKGWNNRHDEWVKRKRIYRNWSVAMSRSSSPRGMKGRAPSRAESTGSGGGSISTRSKRDRSSERSAVPEDNVLVAPNIKKEPRESPIPQAQVKKEGAEEIESTVSTSKAQPRASRNTRSSTVTPTKTTSSPTPQSPSTRASSHSQRRSKKKEIPAVESDNSDADAESEAEEQSPSSSAGKITRRSSRLGTRRNEDDEKSTRKPVLRKEPSKSSAADESDEEEEEDESSPPPKLPPETASVVELRRGSRRGSLVVLAADVEEPLPSPGPSTVEKKIPSTTAKANPPAKIQLSKAVSSVAKRAAAGGMTTNDVYEFEDEGGEPFPPLPPANLRRTWGKDAKNRALSFDSSEEEESVKTERTLTSEELFDRLQLTSTEDSSATPPLRISTRNASGVSGNCTRGVLPKKKDEQAATSSRGTASKSSPTPTPKKEELAPISHHPIPPPLVPSHLSIPSKLSLLQTILPAEPHTKMLKRTYTTVAVAPSATGSSESPSAVRGGRLSPVPKKRAVETTSGVSLSISASSTTVSSTTVSIAPVEVEKKPSTSTSTSDKGAQSRENEGRVSPIVRNTIATITYTRKINRKTSGSHFTTSETSAPLWVKAGTPKEPSAEPVGDGEKSPAPSLPSPIRSTPPPPLRSLMRSMVAATSDSSDPPSLIRMKEHLIAAVPPRPTETSSTSMSSPSQKRLEELKREESPNPKPTSPSPPPLLNPQQTALILTADTVEGIQTPPMVEVTTVSPPCELSVMLTETSSSEKELEKDKPLHKEEEPVDTKPPLNEDFERKDETKNIPLLVADDDVKPPVLIPNAEESEEKLRAESSAKSSSPTKKSKLATRGLRRVATKSKSVVSKSPSKDEKPKKKEATSPSPSEDSQSQAPQRSMASPPPPPVSVSTGISRFWDEKTPSPSSFRESSNPKVSAAPTSLQTPFQQPLVSDTAAPSSFPVGANQQQQSPVSVTLQTSLSNTATLTSPANPPTPASSTSEGSSTTSALSEKENDISLGLVPLTVDTKAGDETQIKLRMKEEAAKKAHEERHERHRHEKQENNDTNGNHHHRSGLSQSGISST